MFKRWLMLTLLVVSSSATAAQAQEDLPPPLGFSGYDEYINGYQIYDFITGQIESVERDKTLPEPSVYVDSTPPEEIIIESPHDPSVKFVFVSTEPIVPNEHIDYSLYHLANDGTRQLVIEHAEPQYPVANYWSPNGNYLYVLIDRQPSSWVTLYQLDLRTMQLTRLKEQVSGINNCQTDTVWCIVKEYGVRTDTTYPVTLHLLNRDEATLQRLGTSVLIFTNVMWLDTSTQFLYAIATSTDQYAIHRYDATAQTDQLLADIQTIHITYWHLSPDTRWLLVKASLSKEVFGGLYALDLQNEKASPILLTSHLTPISQSPVTSLRWLDDNTLIYTTYVKDEGRAIYSATFPDGETRQLASFEREMGFFDHDWSPDGRWLILSEYRYSNTPASLYLVSMNGGVREIPLASTDNQPICVGWFTRDEYLSQKANICDMHIGIG